MRRIHRQPRDKFHLFSILKKINIFKYLSISLIILFIFYIPAVVKRLIKIDKIECSSQFGNCDEVLANRLQVIGNYKASKEQIERELKQNIRIDNYIIQYKIPSTLKVDLVLKKTKYCIKNLSNNYYLVDNNGVVIDIADNSDMNCITSNINYVLGQKVSDKVFFTVKLTEKVSLITQIQSINVDSVELKIINQESKLIRLPLEGDIDVLVGSLRLIFSRLNENQNGIRMEDVHEIDLRFTNPVLRL